MTKRLKLPKPPKEQKTIDGRFRIVSKIGEGATGTVYEGMQLSVDRPVAVKVLHPRFSIHDDQQERFSREAKAIARLNHTNCITLFDFGYTHEFKSFYMVTEFVEGRELFDMIKHEPPTLPAALDLIVQVADAVAHAHQHNILHRDLKPENVLVTEEGIAKVLDFGMARIVDKLATDQGGRLTEEGAVYGTPAYMSPEQCQGNIHVNEETDIYSLGVMLYELVEGKLPFRKKKIVDVLVQHVKDPVPEIEADIPDRLRSLIKSMLSKRGTERPSSAEIVAETLRSIRLEVPLEGEERNTLDVSQEIQKTLIGHAQKLNDVDGANDTDTETAEPEDAASEATADEERPAERPAAEGSRSRDAEPVPLVRLPSAEAPPQDDTARDETARRRDAREDEPGATNFGALLAGAAVIGVIAIVAIVVATAPAGPPTSDATVEEAVPVAEVVEEESPTPTEAPPPEPTAEPPASATGVEDPGEGLPEPLAEDPPPLEEDPKEAPVVVAKSTTSDESDAKEPSEPTEELPEKEPTSDESHAKQPAESREKPGENEPKSDEPKRDEPPSSEKSEERIGQEPATSGKKEESSEEDDKLPTIRFTY